MTKHYVISDLHLGMGPWHRLEDFISDARFREFLDQIVNEAGDELIINGDWIDFPQLESLDSYPVEKLFSVDGHRLGWTEVDSLEKLENCMAEKAHKGFFDDLGAFLRAGKRVTVALGNHDPDLFWGSVNQTLRSRLAPPPRPNYCNSLSLRFASERPMSNMVINMPLPRISLPIQRTSFISVPKTIKCVWRWFGEPFS